ncbi:MAG: hypothetical protein ABSG89_00005 [Bacteroidales bacterium]|jgi:hypothetical protein
MKNVKITCSLILFLVLFIISCGCSGNLKSYSEAGREAEIFPDYNGVTFPPNIAPANFIIRENADRYRVNIHSGNKDGIIISSGSGRILIPAGKWKRLLQKCKGNDMFVDIYGKKKGKWLKYNRILNHVANENIDNILVYRLIEPGFESWNRMGIYQRCLENFSEKPVMVNDMSDNNCMNCHSFCLNNSSIMMFHMRAKHAGTIIYRNGRLEKINTKTSNTISAGVYPSWHPGGRFIAFSVNNIVQMFHSVPGQKVDVIDTLSDIIIYDTETRKVSTCDAISTKENLETFPAWSPDGRYLYFCSAKAVPLAQYNQVRYDLLRIAFDPASKHFGAVDTVVSAARNDLSVSFPRVSPDGRYVLFCMSHYGNFSIWHPESDLYLKDLKTGEIIKPEINSGQTESYHSWSLSGRWIVFSSRRLDGMFTRPFISYFDTSGHAWKPFLLPQKDPLFYDTFIKSYNVPELVTSEIKLNPRILSGLTDDKIVAASFDDSK